MCSRAVIVDLNPILPALQEKLSDLESYSIDLDTLLQMGVTYVENENEVDEGLENMASRIVEEAWSFGEPDETEVDRLVEGALIVGNFLHETFREAGVYDADGSLGPLHFDRYRGRRGTDAIFVSDEE